MAAVGPEYGFGLYVHWPYCSRICPYCDFNVYAAKDRDSAPLLRTIVEDIKAHRARLPDHPPLESVFLGGGTPSLLSGADIEQILQAAEAAFGLAENAEITLEANPNDILRADPADWAKAGVTRLSIGVQSLNDKALSFLGRDHDSASARHAIDLVQPLFDNHSIDLIYARPGQTIDAWQSELTEALSLGAPHLSLYELTIEARTVFGKRAARGELTPMPDDDQVTLYELTQEICEAHGVPAYEVSNHARDPRFESRHNHIYWASGDWIGAGPGAHGRLTVAGERVSTEAARRPENYISEPTPAQTELSCSDTATEFLAMGLRPVSGLDLDRFEKLFGHAPAADALNDLVSNGYARISDGRLHLTTAGRLLADHIAHLLTIPEP